jgi:osmotically-inducible protein OsmY
MASEGQHKGAGPKSEKPQGDAVWEAVHDKLTEEPWLDATDIVLSVSGGDVTLTGTVPSQHEVDLAGKAAAEAKGVTNVANNLTVNANSGVAETNRIRSITDGNG